MEKAAPPPSPTHPAPHVNGVEPEVDLTGKTLGDFHVLRLLGQGGMGQVYLAEQLSLKRKVALKIMKRELAVNTTALKRFKAEAEAVARLTHANIVQVYAIGESDGLNYMALEYVEGRNLRDYLARKGPPEVPLALSIIQQVAAALHRASELGIVHRDIKPENILLTRKGEVKITDFGLSRCFANDRQPLNLTATNVTMGTPLYMSPEQVQGLEIDPRTDLYSFGVTCYHILAGHPPYTGKTAFEVAMQHVNGAAVPLAEIRPDLPPDLCAIVHKLMARKPEDRFQTGRELLKEVKRLREMLSTALAVQPTQAFFLGGSSQSQAILPAGSGTQPQAQPGSAVNLQGVPPSSSGRHGSGRDGASQLRSSAPVPPLRKRGWVVGAAVLVTVLLASLGGAGVRLWRDPPYRPAPVLTLDSIDPAAPVPPINQRERFLLEAVKQDSNPENGPQAIRGLENRLELGFLYLEQGRLDEAEQFFTGLLNHPHPVKEYVALGRVGQAIVWSFQDRTAESNERFLKLFKDRQAEPRRLEDNRFLFYHPQLRAMVARALNRNAENTDVPFPPQLDYLRKPPANLPPGPGVTRPSGPTKRPPKPM